MYKAFRNLFSGGLLGKVLGMVRELTLAALFGTSNQIDAYRASLTASLMPVHFFIGDSLNAGFIPLYTRYLREDRARADALFWMLNLMLGVAGLLITVVLLVATDPVLKLLVPGFSVETRALTAQFVRVMAIGIPFYVQSALFAYLEMGHARYTLQSLRASAQSIGLIAGTLIAYWLHQPIWLAWGFTLGYIAYTVWGWMLMVRLGFLGGPRNWHWSDARAVTGDFWNIIKPLLLLPVLLQGNIALERAVASLLGSGVLASLDYARLMTDTGVLLVGVPLGLASLAELSRIPADEARRRLVTAIAPLLIVMVPASAFVAVNSEAIVRVMFARGAFNEQSVALTGPILLGLALGFWAQIAGYVLIKSLNAQFRNREVVLYTGVALVFNLAINLAGYRFFGPLTLGVGASVNALALLILSARALQLGRDLCRTLIPLLAGVIVYAPLAWWLHGNGVVRLALSATLAGVFWIALVLAVPVLRESVSPVWRRWRPA